MVQPTPPGDAPLFEGLGKEWNDIVGALPEDRRAELAPRIKERLDQYAPLQEYSEFHRSGVTPDHLKTVLNVYNYLEQNPREVYEAIGQHLGVTTQQAKEVIQEINDGDDADPRIATLKQQVDTLTQIALAQRDQTQKEREAAEQDAAMEKEMAALKKKYGDDVDEEEVLMRMYNKNMTMEQAHLAYMDKVSKIRERRPAPMLMGGGGHVPRQEIDPTKLNSAQTKDVVAQMLQHAAQERKN